MYSASRGIRYTAPPGPADERDADSAADVESTTDADTDGGESPTASRPDGERRTGATGLAADD